MQVHLPLPESDSTGRDNELYSNRFWKRALTVRRYVSSAVRLERWITTPDLSTMTFGIASFAYTASLPASPCPRMLF